MSETLSSCREGNFFEISAISKKTDWENLEIQESRDSLAKADDAMRSSIGDPRQLTRRVPDASLVANRYLDSRSGRKLRSSDLALA